MMRNLFNLVQILLTVTPLTLITIITLLLLMCGLLVYLLGRNGRKLRLQQQQLDQLQQDRTLQEQRISLLSAMVEGEEKEKTDIARDLHDDLGGLLSGIKLQLFKVKSTGETEQLADTIGHVDSAIDELRKISRTLMPETLLRFGLDKAIQEYCRQLGNPVVACHIFTYSQELSQHRQIMIYRIMQELVNNAIRHAAATQVLVQLEESEGFVSLIVEDNGKGFDPSEPPPLHSAGLSGIQARAAYLNAKIKIQSKPGKGTTVLVECPVG